MYNWDISNPWNICPIECGQNTGDYITTRNVICKGDNDSIGMDSDCNEVTKPATEQDCPSTNECGNQVLQVTYSWIVTEETECPPPSCEENIQTFSVQCVSNEGNVGTDDQCNDSKPDVVQKYCPFDPECPGKILKKLKKKHRIVLSWNMSIIHNG